MTQSFVPILMLLAFGGILAAILLAASVYLGRYQRNPSKLAPYESGVPQLDSSRKRVNVRFYQIAMLFILFDIEAAFLYPWAVIYREATITPTGVAWFIFLEMLVFILLLGVGYVYVWKKRAFDWT
jgi:NADH-quinone oxidoreductase subunit A